MVYCYSWYDYYCTAQSLGPKQPKLVGYALNSNSFSQLLLDSILLSNSSCYSDWRYHCSHNCEISYMGWKIEPDINLILYIILPLLIELDSADVQVFCTRTAVVLQSSFLYGIVDNRCITPCTIPLIVYNSPPFVSTSAANLIYCAVPRGMPSGFVVDYCKRTYTLSIDFMPIQYVP